MAMGRIHDGSLGGGGDLFVRIEAGVQ